MSIISSTHTLPLALGVVLIGFVAAGINQFNVKEAKPKSVESVAVDSYHTRAASVAAKLNILSEPAAERVVSPSSPALPLFPESVASFEEVQDVVNAINNGPREEILRFVDRFNTLSADNVYLPAMYKAAIEKLAQLDFNETLEEMLFRVSDGNGATGTHSDYWNRLALHTLAEQQYDLVHQSFALVSALFNLAPLQNDTTNSSSAKLNSSASEPGTAEHYDIALEHVALADLQGALDFIQSEVVDVADREALIIDVLYDWSERDSDSALEGLTEIIRSDRNLGQGAIVELGQLYASEKYRHSPLEAFEWLRTHPNEELSSTAFDNVLIPWIQDNPDDAYSYLSQLDFTSGIGAPSDKSQLDLAEDILLAFVLNDNEQTAVDWLGLQTNQEIIRRGTDLLATVTTEQ